PMDLIIQNNKAIFGDRTFSCAIGRNGITDHKTEGDGATPQGEFPLRQVFYRPDRRSKPETNLPIRAIDPLDGWCDDPTHKAYNTLIKKPFSASHETLWRDDHIYDLFVEIGFNDSSPVAYRGSAIFMHLIRGDYQPTKGCVALADLDLVFLLSNFD